jgi:hypothetical protein
MKKADFSYCVLKIEIRVICGYKNIRKRTCLTYVCYCGEYRLKKSRLDYGTFIHRKRKHLSDIQISIPTRNSKYDIILILTKPFHSTYVIREKHRGEEKQYKTWVPKSDGNRRTDRLKKNISLQLVSEEDVAKNKSKYKKFDKSFSTSIQGER